MKALALFLCICILAGIPLTACGRPTEYYETTFFAMNTAITVRLSHTAKDGGTLSESALAAIAAEAEAQLDALERSLSRTWASSPTSRLNREGTLTTEDTHFLTVLTRALAVAEDTGGAYSPTLGTLTDLWNITSGGYLPTEAEIADALSHTSYQTLTVDGHTVTKTDADVRLDLGGIGKGYGAATLIEYLSATDVAYGLVSLGGNIGVFGTKPDGEAYTVGITDPRRPDSLLGHYRIRDGFISVSGDYERYFILDGVRYHHIFDPSTGYPANSGLSGAVVFSRDGTLADALSTAAFVMGAEGTLAYYKSHPDTFEAVLVTTDGQVLCTPGLIEAGDFQPLADGYTYLA